MSHQHWQYYALATGSDHETQFRKSSLSRAFLPGCSCASNSRTSRTVESFVVDVYLDVESQAQSVDVLPAQR